MRYHIAYSNQIRLKDGRVLTYDDVELHEETHEYDVGTREKYNTPRKGDELEYLEDFMSGNFVIILEKGDVEQTESE
tara:strand:- start:6156 stop:6386 length:231 start_codon:yes stop_codon:yes gene_type:complete